ncbi:hypothetical protein D9757_008018 [Collybiopsis confluens]|uniref:CRAL-TRIO domain-containing protein n=1 Tax=Collybiopsis confluens TaxID=2823264 RepID=A0A8H5H606_9AGAR|nr:hypothetical protein D9757_008018 [Collybiopsis confluens]
MEDLSAHVGHLTGEQSDALAEFKTKLADVKLYRPVLDGQPASHDDPTLLRFLRARRFDVEKAKKQFADTEMWRTEHDIDTLFRTFDPEEFEDARRFYPRWTGRRDKGGRPLYVYRIASVSSIQRELNEASSERRYQRIIVLYEAMRRFVFPLCSKLPHSTETPISSVMTIIDLADTSLATMWNLRNHLQEASRLATAHYPETLHRTVIINAPDYFNRVWSWVKSWFDEGTRRKIFVLTRDEMVATLTQFVDSKDLPKIYGGELEWEFTDEPLLDEDTTKEIREMPKGPVVFP